MRALFTPGRRRFLMAGAQTDSNPRHHVAGAGSRLIWWRVGRLPKPEQPLDAFLAEGETVRRAFLDG